MPQFKFNTISRIEIENSTGGAQMIHAIDYNGSDNLFITGVPGSGKTTVGLMRAERLVNEGKNILFLTFHHLLVNSLKSTASQKLSSRINKFHRWYSLASKQRVDSKTVSQMLDDLKSVGQFDEILIDEGQDFDFRIYKCLAEKCIKFTASADNAQRVHSNGLMADQIKMELEIKGKVTSIPLQYNYRNTFEIYNFARFFLPFNERANNKLAIDRIKKGNGALPTVFLAANEESRLEQLRILLENSGDRNTAVLVFLKEDVNYYENKIKEMGFQCSKHHSDEHVGFNIENILVTTLKSAKGVEFQVVIMPNMETAMDSQIKTAEHYYVGSTRSKESLYIISKGDKLPRYFNQFESGSYTLTKVNLKLKERLKINDDDADLPF